ncbi:MAG TPA: J domain-containing protein [Rhodospirillales bacterium]|nr:J domain-containing protein [Rhodospirillales bacterium]
MLALQTKRRCIHCGNIGRPELNWGIASFIGGIFWGALIISFFVPVLFFATGLLLLWMFFTRQVVCQHCGKELLTYEEVRSTYTKDEYDDDNSSSYQDYTNKKNGSRDSESQEKTEGVQNNRIFSCPSCKQKIRASLPLPSGVGKCKSCGSKFTLYADNKGHLYIESISADDAIHDNDSITSIYDCFALLGLQENAGRQEIKNAYRKKMMEYHPDKVSSLGSKLKSLAEHESKKLNYAVEMLKDNGYL